MNAAALIWCLIVIVVGVVVDYKWKVPLGFVCILGAFLIGYAFLNMSPSKVLKFFPSAIIMNMVMAITFFGFFTENGTAELITSRVMNMLKGRLKLLPIVGIVLCTFLSFFISSMALKFAIGPILLGIAVMGGDAMLVMMTLVLNYALMMGSQNPYMAIGGITMSGQLSQQGFAGATPMAACLWINCMIGLFIALVVYYFVFRCHKAPRVEMKQLESKEMTKEQKTSLRIIAIVVAILIIPAVLDAFLPGKFFTVLAAVCCPQIVFSAGVLVAVVLKVADYKSVVNKQNSWSLVLMITGVTFVIQVAAAAGLGDVVSLAANTLPSWSIAPLLVLLGAFLSFFAAAPTIIPLMFPIACALAGDPTQMLVYLSCAAIGTCASACSPFSSSGATCLAVAPANKQEMLAPKMFACALITPIIIAAFAAVGGFTPVAALMAGTVY